MYFIISQLFIKAIVGVLLHVQFQQESAYVTLYLFQELQLYGNT